MEHLPEVGEAFVCCPGTTMLTQVFPANGIKFNLAELRRLVGGNISILGDYPLNEGMIIIGVEDGISRGLPINDYGSDLCMLTLRGKLLFVSESLIE